jgi:hypothetical protein
MNDKNEFDPLHRIELLAESVDKSMETYNKSIWRKYPISFSLLVLCGAVAVSDGIKGLIEGVPYLDNNPLLMLIIGLLILSVSGSLYKKMRK